jgi:hypothetical protein
MTSTYLSPHFTLDELTASQTAVRRGIDNKPTIAIMRNLTRVAETLEKVRALVGKPITISSGYRCSELNREVGGASSSAHVLGLAADINCPGMSPKELARTILAGGIEFDQLIYEGAGGGGWVHIGLSAGAPRNEVLTAHFGSGQVMYTRGIA